MPVVSGSRSIRVRSPPVMAPAMVRQIPAEEHPATKPASAPVTRAMIWLACACSSTMSTP